MVVRRKKTELSTAEEKAEKDRSSHSGHTHTPYRHIFMSHPILALLIFRATLSTNHRL